MNGERLRTALAERVLVLDGAIGTALMARVGQPCGSLDALSLTRPALVASVHDAYLAAGADIITTNSFQASRLAQAGHGLGHQASDMTIASARLARAAADDWSVRTPRQPRFVAGSIGPVPNGDSRSERAGAYLEQASALLRGGVDLVMLETMTSVDQAAEALSGVVSACAATGVDVPVLVSFCTALSANDVTDATRLDAAGLGVNCLSPSPDLASTLDALASATSGYHACHPSAGLPVDGRYPVAPADFAAFAGGLARQGGVDIVGGCCGTTPAHIRAVADAVRDARPRPVAQHRRAGAAR